eukprot:SAG31_NODE_1829_length_7156_cov_3.390251_4_plen_116_part_00
MPRGTGDEGGLPAMGDANGTIAQDMATGGTAAMDGLDAVTATAAGPRIPEDMGGAGTPTDMGGAGTPTNVNVMYGMDDVPPEMVRRDACSCSELVLLAMLTWHQPGRVGWRRRVI